MMQKAGLEFMMMALFVVATQNYLCAAFHFIFQPNTAVSQKIWNSNLNLKY